MSKRHRLMLLTLVPLALLLGVLIFNYAYSANPTEKSPAVNFKSSALDFDSDKVYHGTHCYSITGNEIQPSYLYGLCHIKPSGYQLPTQLTSILDKTNQLVTEIDYNSEEYQTLQSNAIAECIDFYENQDKEELCYSAPFFEYLISEKTEKIAV